MEAECGGFQFTSNFDSGNLGRVELHSNPEEDVDFEFNLWTKPDCALTEFENGNRTWFYFGMKGGVPFSQVKLNIMNLNKQSKMYGQGMCPVWRVAPTRQRWERIKDRPSFALRSNPSVQTVDNNEFVLSFKQRLPDTTRCTVYFAFTYPFCYAELQAFLNSLELVNRLKLNYRLFSRLEEIYYEREVVCYSTEGRRVELLTISSHHDMSSEREPRLANLFPDLTHPRPFKFNNKRIIFLSSRVHPGETPSSFVLNGMLSMLTDRNDLYAQILRRHFVFKVIPMLNPDGVYAGNYRTDTRGVNLNRVYSDPSPILHPSIYAARSILRYSHFGQETIESEEWRLSDRVSGLSLTPNQRRRGSDTRESKSSGLFLYVDMHGHASKKGIFMYGNHFERVEDNVECMLLPKLVSINSQHFHFDSCNFSERNMYLKDKKDGSSREGCGRVAVLKATGVVRSYTLECNYNTGKSVNRLVPALKDTVTSMMGERKQLPVTLLPPKYNPHLYEEVGRSILVSILDLVSLHPNSRLVNTPHRNLPGVREALRLRAQADANLALHKQNFTTTQNGKCEGGGRLCRGGEGKTKRAKLEEGAGGGGGGRTDKRPRQRRFKQAR